MKETAGMLGGTTSLSQNIEYQPTYGHLPRDPLAGLPRNSVTGAFFRSSLSFTLNPFLGERFIKSKPGVNVVITSAITTP